MLPSPGCASILETLCYDTTYFADLLDSGGSSFGLRRTFFNVDGEWFFEFYSGTYSQRNERDRVIC